MKNTNKYVIKGKVSYAQGESAPSLFVEVWDKDPVNSDCIGRWLTDEKGTFSAEFSSAGFSEWYGDHRPDVYFKVYRGTSVILDTERSILCNLSEGEHSVDLVIAHLNGSKDPTTWHGPLIDATLLDRFRAKLSDTLCQIGETEAERHVDSLRAPFAHLPDLMDLAGGVLAGDPMDIRSFREAISSAGQGVVPARMASMIFESHKGNECSCGQKKDRPLNSLSARGSDRSLADKDPSGLFDLSRMEAVLAATVAVARSTDELIQLAGNVFYSLQGLDELDSLYRLTMNNADPIDVHSAFGTAVRTSAFFGFDPFEGFSPDPGGWPMPGNGFIPWPPTFEFPLPGFDPSPGFGGTPQVPGVGELDPSLTEHFENCFIFNVIPELHRRGIGFPGLIYGVGDQYEIASIEPQEACPGDILTITGSNFDGTESVRFVDRSGGRIAVAPLTLSSTGITVALPAQAANGPVSLYIPVHTTLCLEEFVMAKPGIPGELEVGLPRVLLFEPVGRQCLDVDESIMIRWRVQPVDAEITVSVTIDGTTTPLCTDCPSTGSLSYHPPVTGDHTMTIQVVNSRTSTCAESTESFDLMVRDPSPEFSILGVETTQAIQRFNTTDFTDPTNNNIPLIASMDTVLRVYFSVSSGSTERFTGYLLHNGNVYHPINDFSPGTFSLPAVSVPTRSITDHSLNFMIPAADAVGENQDVRIHMFSAGDHCFDLHVVEELSLTWHDRPHLPVTIRRIAESNGAVISVADALSTVRSAMRRMPTPRRGIVVKAGVFQINEGTAEDNYCTDGGYYQLALSVGAEHNYNEGEHHTSSWIGLYPSFCDVGGMMAWPQTSTCISEDDVAVAAHELMHTVGLGHVKTGIEDCESIPQPVACHFLPGRADGALDEIPFDIDANSTVIGAFDLQSYRGEDLRWLSPELWELGRELMDHRY